MKQRVISAFFLLLIGIPLVIAGDKVFALSIGMVGIFALKEIIDLKKSHGSIPAIMTVLFYIFLLFIVYISPFEYSNLVGINYKLIGLMLAFYLIPTLFSGSNQRYTTSDAFYFLGMTLFLGLACHSIIMIRSKDLWLFLYLILIPILTDTFAFFIGSFIGKHSLAPTISPKKTWEGSILGTVCATVLSSIFYLSLVGKMNFVPLICITILFSIAGQIGDLLFSKIKRENGIKDFSDLIPGHGGILDRFDSIIFVSIIFVLLIQYI